MSRRWLAILALGAWMDAACAMSMMAQGPDDPSRDQFLRTVDQALTSRDATRLSALADTEQWQSAGHPKLDQLTLWLPPPPLVRKRDLSPNEFLYEDGDGNTWRLRIRKNNDRNAWAVVVLNRPCPTRAGFRGSLGNDAASAPSQGRAAQGTSSSDIWTPLECWPLPR